MTPLTKRRYGHHGVLHWAAPILVVGVLWMIGAWYSTAKSELAPEDTHPLVDQGVAPSDSPALGATNAGFAPFLDIVPSQDGRELFISAGGTGELEGTVFANIGIGPGHYIGSWTMTYSDTRRAYVTTTIGFTPKIDDYGSISITTTHGLDSGTVDFTRAYVPASTIQTISSEDRNLQLTVVTTDTITYDTYVAIVPSYGPPGPAPSGHRFVGSTYSVRAAAALVETDKPMSLRLYYNDIALAGADPHTLAVFAWDACYQRWDNLGGQLFYYQQYLSVATSRFTTYALMSTPAWRDEFYDLSGMDPLQFKNVTWSGGIENQLLLASTPGSGSALSVPITPTTEFANWDSLTFTYTVDPPTTTLTIDVLTLDGTAVLTDVASGADLTDLDANEFPVLKLRANLSSTVAGEAPRLDAWQLAWQVEEHRIYLPVVLK